MDTRQKLIHDALLEYARQGKFPFYSELAAKIGMSPQGLWTPILDAISRYETGAGRSDITFVLRNKRTGLSGQIGFMAAGRPSEAQRMLARQAAQEVIDRASWQISAQPTQ
jgi:hypothetical protein